MDVGKLQKPLLVSKPSKINKMTNLYETQDRVESDSSVLWVNSQLSREKNLQLLYVAVAKNGRQVRRRRMAPGRCPSRRVCVWGGGGAHTSYSAPPTAKRQIGYVSSACRSNCQSYGRVPQLVQNSCRGLVRRDTVG